MNIFEALRKDHDTQRTLSEILTTTSGESEGRMKLFKRLKNELAVHADAEERFFYKPLIDQDSTQELSRHGIAEHHEMDELVEQLEDTDMSSPGWLVTAKKLHDKIHHHLDDEEHKFFQIAGKVFSEKQKTELAKDYQQHVRENKLR